MQAFQLILVVACVAGIASGASSRPKMSCETCKSSMKMIKENRSAFEALMLEHCRLTDPDVDNCIANGYCPRELSLFRLSRQEESKTSLLCTTCKEAMGEVKRYIDAIELSLIMGCHIEVDEGKREACDAARKLYLGYLSKESPEKICQDLYICPRKMRLPGLVRQESAKKSLLCEPCKLIAKKIRKGAPHAQDQMKELCKNSGAPDDVKKCEESIEKYIEYIQEMSVDKFCTGVGLCEQD